MRPSLPNHSEPKPTLIVCAGMSGYRVASVGGARFDVLGLFTTLDEANDARRSAEALSAQLDRVGA